MFISIYYATTTTAAMLTNFEFIPSTMAKQEVEKLDHMYIYMKTNIISNSWYVYSMQN